MRIEKIHVIMNFLPIVLNQLFWVLVQNSDDEVATAVTRYLSRFHIKDVTVHVCPKIAALMKADYGVYTSVSENACFPLTQGSASNSWKSTWHHVVGSGTNKETTDHGECVFVPTGNDS